MCFTDFPYLLEYLDQLPSKKWSGDRRITSFFIDKEIFLSRNLIYEKLRQIKIFYLNRISQISEITTLDVLKKIEKSEGELDLF